MGTGGTARYHWNFPICPTRITIDLTVIGALEHDLATPGNRQGFLYGKEERGGTHINGREPILELNRDAMAESLSNPRRTIVGFYRIRDGSAFILTTEEIETAQELFKRPGSVVLLVERRAAGPAEATFFFWRGDSFVHNLPMPFPLDTARLAAGEPRPMAAARGALRGKHRLALQRVGAIAAGAVVGVGIGAVMMRGGPAKMAPTHTRPAPVAVAPAAEAAKPGSPVEFLWDPKSMPAATAGLLEITDGGRKHTIPLDLEQLRAGSMRYEPATAAVRVELSTLQRDGRVIDNDVTMRPSSQSVEVIAASPVVSPPAAEPPPQATPAQPAEKRVEPPSSSADRRMVLRRFTLAATDAAPDQPSAPIVLDPPAVQAPPVTTAVLPITPALRPHIPPPAAPAPVRTTPASGRLIWTGTILRRGVVELDGRSATVGSISGALPGVPIAVTISPAEFENNGLVVYTTDAARHNRVEPPSAANGWNKVTWVWDPTRVHEIEVIEPPNPSNNFSRLAFRSDARRTSMVWIDWRTK